MDRNGEILSNKLSFNLHKLQQQNHFSSEALMYSFTEVERYVIGIQIIILKQMKGSMNKDNYRVYTTHS